MRLTLRTLLAYLDRAHLHNMLTADEASSLEALGEKISANEFASGLVERIHSSLGRERLGAPKLDGKGIGLDPNTVAEFLDNSLAQERMQEFEKVCLESDIHLAEVAACHHILSLVLAERPDIPLGLRERMRDLPQRKSLESTVSAVSPIELSAPPSTAHPPPLRVESTRRLVIDRSPRVPEYLRASRRSSWKPILATLALVLLLLVAGLLAMGRLDESHPLLGPLLADRSSPAPSVETTPGPAESADIPAPGDSGPPDRPSATNGSAAEPARAPEPVGGQPSAVDEPLVRDEGDEADELAAPSESPPPVASAEPAPPDEPVVRPPLSPREDVAATRPTDEAPDASSAPREVPADDPLAGLARALAPPPGEETPPTQPSSDRDGQEVGTSPNGLAREVGRMIPAERDPILARWDGESGAWYRLPARSVLSAGDRLLVLPSYRPQVALSSGIHIMFVGPANVEMGAADAAGIPRLRIDEGRSLLDTAGIAGSQLHLQLPSGEGTLTFESTDSALALEVRPLASLGQDPGAREPILGCEIYSMAGSLTWRDPAGNRTPLKSGQLLWLTAHEPPVVHDAPAPPAWIAARDQREIDLRASRELAQLVDISRPISLSLFEQVGHRQIEVSALAIESLTLLSEFDPAVQALRNERHQAYWRSYIGALEAAMRRGPATAAAVEGALSKQLLDNAPIVYRLLYGYSEQQLAAGGAQELVGLLESPLMEVRILAIENLRRITNRTHMYRPEREPVQQRKPLQDWRHTLNRGEITYKSDTER